MCKEKIWEMSPGNIITLDKVSVKCPEYGLIICLGWQQSVPYYLRQCSTESAIAINDPELV